MKLREAEKKREKIHIKVKNQYSVTNFIFNDEKIIEFSRESVNQSVSQVRSSFKRIAQYMLNYNFMCVYLILTHNTGTK